MIADSHCHLDFPNLYDELDLVVKRAELNNVRYLLTICTTLKSFERIKIIISRYKDIYGTFGIHPHETKTHQNVNKEIILNYKKKNKKIIGIGETGLDFYYNNSDKDSQIESFENHIEAAIELNIPLIVHSRNAESETYDILKNKYSDNLKILMHCFTGSTSFSKNLLKLNAYFSASGIITFKNSLELQETFKQIPLDNLLIETDSPFLTPVPMRGKKNEPSFIKYTLEKLALLKNIEIFELDKITSDNFNKLFFS